MSQYLLLLYGGREAMQRLSPDEAQVHMVQWRSWFQDLVQKGLLVGGQPLGSEGRVLAGREGKVVKDGPYAEAKETVAGYVIVNADNIESAVEIARGCPGLQVGTEVEVRPIADMP